MTTNPINYTSRTFNTILNDINNDANLVDTPNWYKIINSGVGDVISMYINATANQSTLATSFTRSATADLCALLDYYLSAPSTSSGTLIYYLNPDTVVFPKTIQKENLKARSQGNINVSSKPFEARADVIASATSETFTVNFTTDLLTVARVYTTGEKVRVSSTTALPAGLSSATDYYVIYVSSTTIRLAENIEDAFLNNYIDITDAGTGTHTITLYSVQVTCYQQETAATQIIGTSDGITEWQEFDLFDLNILEDTLSIVANSVTWTLVTTLVDSTSTDTHYLLRYNTVENTAKIIFGNGTYGKIPGNFDITSDYATGGGVDSNISSLNTINIYAGSDADVVGVTNSVTFTGGGAAENTERAKILAPLLLKARDRNITSADGEALALAYTGVIRAKVIANAYGLLSEAVPIVPNGGGLPSSALKTALQTYLIDRTVLESIDVRVLDPTYSTITPVVQVKILPGYTWATGGDKDVQPFVILALRLIFSEVTYEIQQDFLANGIASAVTFINTKWSVTFDSDDYNQITDLLNKITAGNFGEEYQRSEIISVIQSYVEGVDYIKWISPSVPITLTNTQIATDNVVAGNVTQIT